VSKQKLPRLIGITVEELQSQSSSVRRKVRRAFVHNAGILFGPESQDRVSDHLDQGTDQADGVSRNSGTSTSNK
jgi:hypothetical protein